MEEGKSNSKMNLLSFLLMLLIILIVISVMGVFIYNLYIERNEEMNKVIELQTEVDELKNTINGLQETDISLDNAVNNDIIDVIEEPVSFDNLSYDIVVREWEPQNSEIVGGYASIYYATLVNYNKKERYDITFSDVWEVHEERGDKDYVSIEIHKISENRANDYYAKYSRSESLLKVKDFIDKHVDADYDNKITIESIDDIEYDVLVKSEVKNITESFEHKTEDGIYAIENCFSLINTQLKKKYQVYCDDLAEVYNEEGSYDSIFVRIEDATDEEIQDVSYNKSTVMLKLTDLISDIVTDEYDISVSDFSDRY